MRKSPSDTPKTRSSSGQCWFHALVLPVMALSGIFAASAGPDRRGAKQNLTRSVLKALDVLECLQATGGPLSPAELAARLGLSRPTAYRLLVTMAERGWVTRDLREPGKYRPGYRVLQLAGACLIDLDIRLVARPFMEQLSQTYDESVTLFILDESEVVFIDRVLNSHPLQSFLPLGKRGCLHSKAVGKAILAYLPEERVEHIIQTRGLEAMTPNTITDPMVLRQELDRTRRRGYAITDQEDVEGLCAVGAAIFDFRRQPVGGLAISGLASHMNDERRSLLGPAIRDTAARVSEQLGCPPTIPGTPGGEKP